MKDPVKPIIDTHRRELTVGLSAGLLGLTSQSCAVSGDKAMPYAKPAPFTAMEFWQRVLDLVNEKGADRSRERIERAVGTKFVRIVGEVETRAHFLDYGVHWYFNVRLSGGTSRPSLDIFAPDQQVLKFADGPLKYSPIVYDSLLQNGLLKSPPLAHFVPNFHRFNTDFLSISIGEADNSVTDFRFTWLP
jgi:hypothetical protein